MCAGWAGYQGAVYVVFVLVRHALTNNAAELWAAIKALQGVQVPKLNPGHLGFANVSCGYWQH